MNNNRINICFSKLKKEKKAAFIAFLTSGDPDFSMSLKLLKAMPKAGVDIIKKALQAPIRQIAANAGVDGSVVVGKLLDGKKQSQVFDAQEEEYVDMFSKGIIDPMKVVRSALQDASSIAGLLITT